MSNADWVEIERVLLEALALAPAERPAFLDEACAGRAGLRAEVESLLEADAQRGDFLERPPARLAAELLASHSGALPEGARAGGYEIEALISVGGMGEVYRARHAVTREPAALKVLRRHLTADAGAVDRFEREARAAGALDHPNIIRVYEFGESGVGHFIAMEFVDGPTWRALMNEGLLELGAAAEYSRQAAHALAAAHEAGILHRDIKPDNIMINGAGAVKVLDFGLARLAGHLMPDPEAAGSAGTISGTLSGTLPYMSPELLLGEAATAGSDVFSFGSVLYELFTGHHPFAGETPLDVFEAIEGRTPEAPRALRAGMPEALERLLLAMLGRVPGSRPSMREVAAALDGLAL